MQQISNIWEKWRVSGDIRAELALAFDVEAVTKRFFAEYKKVFDAAMEKISGFGDDEEEVDRKNQFVQTLFNRLMFVFFISRKGWLEYDGDKDYLNALWRGYTSAGGDDGFYESRLKPLFFDGLNKIDRPIELIAKIDNVPFFNGGLFYESNLDRLDCVEVPDDAIRPMMTEVFDRFNFTVMESTDYDVEVAVDPEMLGKVFEELVTARHDSGAYYTPRLVVSFMCREALKGYLAARVGAADKAAITGFVDERSTEGIGLNAAQQIAASLDMVKVVDPACGSGAYLLGMMHELVRLHTALFNVGVTSKSVYDLKMKIIRDNLYGADIDEFAINIAMLRLWLSLAIDYDGPIPQPLPNLDFKMVRGDSLLGPDPAPETVGELSSHWVRDLKIVDLKARYLDCHDPDEKAALRTEILDATDRIRNAFGDATLPSDVVDWRVTFAEVFADGKGYDIAVANPPYVRQEKIGDAKAELRRIYADSTVARSDLYCYFYVRGLQLLRAGGMHVFVCSNSWLDVGYGAKLQEYLLKNARVDAIYESAVERQFSTAQINTIISVVSKSQGGDDQRIRFVSLRDEFESAISDASKRREIEMSSREIMESSLGTPDRNGRPKFVGDKWGAKYLRAPDIYRTVLAKGAGKLVRLGDVATVKRGITTGANGIFYLTPEDIAQWGIEDEFLKPVMTSPQESKSLCVDPLRLPYRAFVCHKSKQQLRNTAALEYIIRGEKDGVHHSRSLSSRVRWWDLGDATWAQTAMNTLVSSTARTFLASERVLFDQCLYTISTNRDLSNRMCLILNSSLTQLMLNLGGRVNFGGGLLRIAVYELGMLQVLDPHLVSPIDENVFSATDWGVTSPSSERRMMDDAVFDALGLTEGERDGVYEGVRELVENRMRRARSV